MPGRVTDPEEIRFLLRDLSREALIVLDELDRVEDNEALSLLADTVKTLSDRGTEVTLMFVGVASPVEHLLGEHESIVRNVRQIPMQRMSRDQLETLLEKGFGQVDGLTVGRAGDEPHHQRGGRAAALCAPARPRRGPRGRVR